ncbi:MAG: sigma factor-like helix-turn-helix DNA-binding protein [Prosthecobacter sp.]
MLDEALAELPEQTRAIIVARYLEGSMQQDLAARMGISQSSRLCTRRAEEPCWKR